MTPQHATPADLILRATKLEQDARWAGEDEGNMRDEARNLRALAREALEAMAATAANDNQLGTMPATRGKEVA